jgi:hypothetical protein
MSTDAQFWLNWVVNLAVALGTLGAVLAALFGDIFRSKFLPPLLRLRLLSSEGEKGPIKTTESWDVARWYHVHVWNERRWSPAKEVQIFLIRLEEQDPSGAFQTVWSGEVPMNWRHQEVSPLTRTIGAEADCDLCRVEQKAKALTLLPLISPYNLNARRNGKCSMIAWVQAKSNRADSPLLRIKISWDGDWDDGEKEMKRHLVVEQL